MGFQCTLHTSVKGGGGSSKGKCISAPFATQGGGSGPHGITLHHPSLLTPTLAQAFFPKEGKGREGNLLYILQTRTTY